MADCTSLLDIPPYLLANIFDKASCRGRVKDVFLLSTVCKTFKETVGQVLTLSLDDPKLLKSFEPPRGDLWLLFPDENHHHQQHRFILDIVSLTPNIIELKFGQSIVDELLGLIGSSSEEVMSFMNLLYNITPSTIDSWSNLIGRSLKSLTIVKCSFSLSQLTALAGLQSLQSVWFHYCFFDVDRSDILSCSSMESVKFLHLFHSGCVNSSFLEVLLSMFSSLQTLEFHDPGEKPNQVSVIKSSSLTSLRVSSEAETFIIETPNLIHLHISKCSAHFYIRELKHLQSLIFGNDCDFLARDGRLTIQTPLPSTLRHIEHYEGFDWLLTKALLQSSFSSLENLTILKGLYDCSSLPIFPRMQKLCIYLDPDMDEETEDFIKRVRPWVALCPVIKEVEVRDLYICLSESSSMLEELRSVFPRVKICL